MSDPRRQRRLWYVIGGVLIAGFVAFGATSFKKNITPYVGFEEAQRSASRVQVAGHTMRVLYHGTKPGNFEEAKQIVAVGTYDGDAFQAEQLLVKCPSKYQGLEEAS